MKTDIDQTQFFSRLASSFARFTALPLKKVFTPSPVSDIRAMVLWPLVGWLSGGVAAAIIFLLSPWAGLPIAAGVAIAARCLA